MVINSTYSPMFYYVGPSIDMDPVNVYNEERLLNLSHNGGVFDVFSSGDDIEATAQDDGPMFVRPPMDSTVLKLTELTTWLRLYYTPGMISVGVFGNMLSTTMLLNTQMASLPCSRYLSACVVVDGLYLLNLLFNWFVELGYPLFTVGAVCHATIFISKACAFLSVWYTLCYSVDALIVIKYPNAERTLSTIFKAKLVILLLAIVAVVVFLNISLLVSVINLPMRQACIPLDSFKKALTTLDRMDTFINFLLPYASSVVICTSCALQCYKDGIRMRRGPHLPPQRSVHVECDVEAGLNCLYFTFTLTHLLLTLPLGIMNAVFVVSGFTGAPMVMTLKRYLVMESLRHLYHLRFASHLFVFGLAWKGFRTTLCVSLLRKCRPLLFACRKDNGGNQETRFVDYTLDESDLIMHVSSDVKVENGTMAS